MLRQGYSETVKFNISDRCTLSLKMTQEHDCNSASDQATSLLWSD